MKPTTDLEFDRRGLPLLTDEEKAEVLLECIRGRRLEDALGHALDLAERLRGHEGLVAARNRYRATEGHLDYLHWMIGQ